MSNIGTKFILAQKFIFDPNSNSLIDQTSDDEMVRLGSNESRILLMLAERPNEIITRNELHEYVWRDQGFEVDDSSLTQAVSTLRKLLKDSTKYPEFVKTVPKRGYQFIASVERSSPLSSNDFSSSSLNDIHSASDLPEGSPVSNEEAVLDVEKAALNPEKSEPTSSQNLSESEPTVEAEKPAKTDDSQIERSKSETQKASRIKWFPRIAILFSIALPLLVSVFTTPTKSEFKTLSEINGIKIQSPISQPNLDGFLDSIEKCVSHYSDNRTDDRKPVQVIATGGQSHQIVLNYIHSQEHASDNVTLRIFAQQVDLISLCKGDN